MSEPIILNLPSRNGKNVCFNYIRYLLDEYSCDITMLNSLYDCMHVINTCRILTREIASSDMSVVFPLKESEKTL